MNTNDKIIEYARGKGWIEPDQGTDSMQPRHYRRAALAIRPTREKMSAVASALESRLATTLHLRIMPDHVAGRNRAICESCPDGLFGLLRGGKPVCTQCNCADKWLEAKWKDPKQACPRGYWDNRQEVRNGTP